MHRVNLLNFTLLIVLVYRKAFKKSTFYRIVFIIYIAENAAHGYIYLYFILLSTFLEISTRIIPDETVNIMPDASNRERFSIL